MSTKVEIPALGESVTEAVIAEWRRNDGDQVAADETLCELETDKANVELPSPTAGVLRRLKEAGATVRVGETIAQIEESVANEKPAANEPPEVPSERQSPALPEATKTPQRVPPKETTNSPKPVATEESNAKTAPKPSPAALQPPASPKPAAPKNAGDNGERRVPLSNIRRRIAQRLVQAQQTAAMLTTFNEVDMSAVLDLRGRYQEKFTEAHGVSLGLMSFFARASAVALGQFTTLNAQLDGDEIVYRDQVHLGVAVSTERGLVVPVLRQVESLSLAQIEAEIKRLAAAARAGKLSPAELSGGTFTITNGGVFGSLLSTPILNPPQSGILGLHAIQKRPVVVKDRIRARPMMYVALTYDHRLVDGQESVQFLVRVKELLEDPARMLLEI